MLPPSKPINPGKTADTTVWILPLVLLACFALLPRWQLHVANLTCHVLHFSSFPQAPMSIICISPQRGASIAPEANLPSCLTNVLPTRETGVLNQDLVSQFSFQQPKVSPRCSRMKPEALQLIWGPVWSTLLPWPGHPFSLPPGLP